MNGDKGAEDRGAKRDAEDKALKARLEKLSGALETQRLQVEAKQAQERAVPGGETGKAMSLGFRVLSEFVAGVLAGGVIGWLLDTWFSTSPLFLLVFGTIGTAAGFMNVYRIASRPTMPAPGDKDRTG